MIKKIFFSSLFLFTSVVCNAETVQIDGIWYEIVAKAQLAEVVSPTDRSKYEGDIVIPEKVVHNGIEYTVTSIGNSAFMSCSNLENITLPESLTSIGRMAFYGCSQLRRLTIPGSITTIKDHAFERCPLNSVYINNLVSWCKIDFSDKYSNPLHSAICFYVNNEEVTNLIIPDSVTTIGKYAFYNNCFLTSVTIGNSVTNIGDYAFQNSSSLTDVTIGNSVKEIGNSAFAYSSNLTNVSIGESVTNIKNNAFNECENLKAVHITNIASWCNIDFSNENSNPLYYAHHLYINGSEIKDLVIPNTVNNIKNHIFENCHSITSLTMSHSVAKIGDYAFRRCLNLGSLKIPNSVTSIGVSTFEDCSNLTAVYITDIAAWCKIKFSNSSDNPLYYAHRLYLHDKEVKDLIIPNSVTSIGPNTFYGCSSLTSLTIPNSVTSIGDDAFSGCTGLTSATIPNSVTNIGGSAFRDCSSLTSLTISNSITNIEGRVFYGCSSLTSLTIPNSVTYIGEEAFKDCSKLTNVSIPSSLTQIRGFAFKGCGNLEAVHITDLAAWCKVYFYNAESNPLTFAHHLFINNEEIKNLIIPSSVKCIEGVAFYGCTSLTSITIPNSVTNIKSYAFSKCENISDVFCYAEKVPLASTYYSADDVFANSYIEYATLHVPMSAIDDYKSKTPWNLFGNILPLSDELQDISFEKECPIVIQVQDGTIVLHGVTPKTRITVHTIGGIQVASTVAINNEPIIINTFLQNNEIVIVKIGAKSVKVVI